MGREIPAEYLYNTLQQFSLADEFCAAFFTNGIDLCLCVLYISMQLFSDTNSEQLQGKRNSYRTTLRYNGLTMQRMEIWEERIEEPLEVKHKPKDPILHCS